MANVPLHPKHPERICWGCDRYCPADDLSCGNGTIRTPHPVELLGDDWCNEEPGDLEAEEDRAGPLIGSRELIVSAGDRERPKGLMWCARSDTGA